MKDHRIPRRLGCKGGLPHDLIATHETSKVKCEVCVLCGKRFRWNKIGRNQRVDNDEYLRAHIRNFAQPGGRTNRVYNQIYKPNKMTITL